MRRKARQAIALAAFLAVPRFAMMFAGEGDGGGGGGGSNQPADPPAKKIELTEEELADRQKAAVNAALERERKAAQDREAKDKEERERKEQEQQGKFKELADKEKEKRESAERERDEAKLAARKLEVKDQLREMLAKDHPEYVGVSQYIMPLINFDLKTEQADIDKQIKNAVEQYVKDNPRKAGGATPNPPGRTLPAKPGQQNNGNKPATNRFSPSSRF